MSEINKANTVAFYKEALLQGRVESAFRTYAGRPTVSIIRSSKTGWGASANS